MQDITLVNAAYHPTPLRYDYSTGAQSYVDIDICLPLGPLYLTSMLEEEGWHVDLRDYQLHTSPTPLDPETFANFVSDSCDILGISCMHHMLPLVLLSLKRLKERHPEKTIILGGPGPTGVAERLMAAFDVPDIVVRGEAERTAVELLDHLEKGKDLSGIRGICYREDGRVKTNPPRERIKDLGELPFPAYHKLDMDKYSGHILITARGCPYRCSFCDVGPLWGNTVVNRSIDRVIEELGVMQEAYPGMREFNISDDTFVLSRKRVVEFCEKFRREGIDLEWSCLGRVNLMDEELIRTMASSGCNLVFYGIESGSDRVLERINKQFTWAQAQKVLARTVEHMGVHASFTWGYPFETMEDFYETVLSMAYAARLGTDYSAHQLSPLPASPIYEEYKDSLRFSEQLISDIVISGYMNCTKEAFAPNQGIAALIRTHPRLFSGFYHVASEDIGKKHRIVQRLGLNSRQLRFAQGPQKLWRRREHEVKSSGTAKGEYGGGVS